MRRHGGGCILCGFQYFVCAGKISIKAMMMIRFILNSFFMFSLCRAIFELMTQTHAHTDTLASPHIVFSRVRLTDSPLEKKTLSRCVGRCVLCGLVGKGATNGVKVQSMMTSPMYTLTVIGLVGLWCMVLLGKTHGLATPLSSTRRVSIVTGGNGYLGHEIIQCILKQGDDSDDTIICLVRPNRMAEQQQFWNPHKCVTVLPYDMLDGGTTIKAALQHAAELVSNDNDDCKNSVVVYHVASVFGPTENHEQTALDNVKGAEDVVRAMGSCLALSKLKSKCRLVLTSSMAAVRASGQVPVNGIYYTHEDWNTESVLGANWGASYQWSKAESERRAWMLSRETNVDMVSLCPSFIFGPPAPNCQSTSFSIDLVGQWVRGESDVQSRLCVDVRDVAQAHVTAGSLDTAIGKRFIVSSEARIPSIEMADSLRRVSQQLGLGDPSKLSADTAFTGGAIPVGTQEVEAADRLKNELGGLICRPVQDTMTDMAQALLQMQTTKQDL